MKEHNNYVVVGNEAGQFSIWPSHKPMPAGWLAKSEAASKSDCLNQIEGMWKDIRPQHLLAQIQGQPHKTKDVAREVDQKHAEMIDAYRRRYQAGLDSWSHLGYLKDCVQLFFDKYADPEHQKTVFEIGVGTGISSEPILQAGYQLSGIDVIANDHWEQLRQRHGDNFQSFVGDILTFEPTHRHDIVMDNGCFHHFEEALYPAALGKVKELLAEDGRYFLAVFEEQDASLAVGKSYYLDGGKRRCKFFTPPEIKKVLQDNGFELEATDRVSREMDAVSTLLCIAKVADS
ncbi:MAG: MbtH family NRPS accessory protein [Bacteroidota bacterium]